MSREQVRDEKGMATSPTRRARRKTSSSRDPLSAIVSGIAFAPLLVALAVLHIVYYIYIRIRGAAKKHELTSPKAIEVLAKDVRHAGPQRRRRQQGWRMLWDRQETEAQEELLYIGNTLRLQRVGQAECELATRLQAASKKTANVNMPLQHFALALGPKTIRTSTLLLQALAKASGQVLGFISGYTLFNHPTNPLRLSEEAHQEQCDFVVENARAALRYCAMASVPELTIFDEHGLLREAMQEDRFALDADLYVAGYESCDHESSASEEPRRGRQNVSKSRSEAASPQTPRSRDSSLSGDAAIASGSDAETALTEDSQMLSAEHGKEDDEKLAEASFRPRPNLRIRANVRYPGEKHDDHDQAEHVSLDGTEHYTDPESTASVCVNVLCGKDSKPLLARAANILAKESRASDAKCAVTASDIERTLTVRLQCPLEPDVVLIHGGPRHVSTLHGFPPLMMKLCEIAHDVDARSNEVLTPSSFLYAMRRYKGAEQRFGK